VTTEPSGLSAGRQQLEEAVENGRAVLGRSSRLLDETARLIRESDRLIARSRNRVAATKARAAPPERGRGSGAVRRRDERRPPSR
jgi:hypothetical protein